MQLVSYYAVLFKFSSYVEGVLMSPMIPEPKNETQVRTLVVTIVPANCITYLWPQLDYHQTIAIVALQVTPSR